MHELGHLFGLGHCTFYECIMNGRPTAKARGGVRHLCPICLCKLKLNIKFDVRARYEHLIRVCGHIGLQKEAQTY